MVVPVFINSCLVSETLKNKPVMAQIIMSNNARENARVLPVDFLILVEKFSKKFLLRLSVVFLLTVSSSLIFLNTYFLKAMVSGDTDHGSVPPAAMSLS